MKITDSIKWQKVGDGYICCEDYRYFSKRYSKWITVPKGFFSDGATYAPDIDSRAWGIHDVLCRYGSFDDKSKCTNWQASSVLYDILKEDGYVFRAPWWRAATYLFGGGAARKGKIYERDSRR